MLKKIKEYNEWAKEFTMNTWNMRLDIPIKVTYSGANGCFVCLRGFDDNRKGQLEIKLNYALVKTHDEMLNVLKHELAHWYCYVTGKDYSDGDRDFEKVLYEIGASSTGWAYNNPKISHFMQENIIAGKMNRHGLTDVRYKKIPLTAINELDIEVLYPFMLKPRFFNGAYNVYYNDKQIGIIIKYNQNCWATLTKYISVVDGMDIRHQKFKARKHLVNEMVLSLQEMESKNTITANIVFN